MSEKKALFPDSRPCPKCGGPWQYELNGRHYCGSYGGLCYDCFYAEDYIEATLVDGAHIWDRRPMYAYADQGQHRESYTAYDGCEVCHGKGYLTIERPARLGGSYRTQCGLCGTRYHSFPARVDYGRQYEALRVKMYADTRKALSRAHLLWTIAGNGPFGRVRTTVQPPTDAVERKHAIEHARAIYQECRDAFYKAADELFASLVAAGVFCERCPK